MSKRICIVGPGAVGGLLAALLAKAGHQVSALARPARAQAINARGITLRSRGQPVQAAVRAATDPKELGPQDIVLVTVKGGGLSAVAPQIPALLGPDTNLITVLNGLPWWFFDGFGGRFAGAKLRSVDPDGRLEKAFPADRLIWGVINVGAVEEPDGSITQTPLPGGLVLGRPHGDTAGLDEIAALITAAGFETRASANIRQDIWLKLQGNLTLNPIGAITMATLDIMFSDDLLRDFIATVINEARNLATKLGLDPGVEGHERMKGAAARAASMKGGKSSMHQDAEKGRPLEIAPIVGAVVEVADIMGEPAPFTKALYGLVRVRAKAGGLV